MLTNNAGGVYGDPTRTLDGFEKTFQINHLAPFLSSNRWLAEGTPGRDWESDARPVGTVGTADRLTPATEC
ncbi:hypothetical protein [Streptomyces sp. NPDC058665]|uniref:hypothetical protein n=1 Tax=Streptomyces sp. NPDC058665 TaxID=3346586 RepID=UPI00366A54B3